jgi:hypothetical protein
MLGYMLVMAAAMQRRGLFSSIVGQSRGGEPESLPACAIAHTLTVMMR